MVSLICWFSPQMCKTAWLMLRARPKPRGRKVNTGLSHKWQELKHTEHPGGRVHISKKLELETEARLKHTRWIPMHASLAPAP